MPPSDQPPPPFIRTCQECGYKQEDQEPPYGSEPPDTYRNRKCKRCKSEALDYGSRYYPETEED